MLIVSLLLLRGEVSHVMPIPVRVDFFWVDCDNTTPTAMVTRAANYAANQPAEPPEWSHELHDYILTDCAWNAVTGLFAGTIWKVLTNDLPSMVAFP